MSKLCPNCGIQCTGPCAVCAVEEFMPGRVRCGGCGTKRPSPHDPCPTCGGLGKEAVDASPK